MSEVMERNLAACMIREWERNCSIVPQGQLPLESRKLKARVIASLHEAMVCIDNLKKYHNEPSDIEAIADFEEAFNHALGAIRDIGTDGIEEPTDVVTKQEEESFDQENLPAMQPGIQDSGVTTPHASPVQ